DRRVHQAYPNSWVGPRLAGEWLHEHSEGPVEQVSWRFPVRPGPAVVLALPPRRGSRCGWQVIASEGFELMGLPASQVELPADVAGTLTIARDVNEDHPACASVHMELPPAPIELDPSWTRLRAELMGPTASR